MFYEPFAIIELDTIDKTSVQYIGHIEIKEAGLTTNCEYETILKIAKKESLKLGGNCLVITEHKWPSLWSTCHRIKADVFWINNPKKYENEIIWNPNRKLEISDFKGSNEKRPFTAVTASAFRYFVEGNLTFPKNYKLIVETYFDCYSSYFKPSEFNAMVLAHEQIHFDISELYARKFIERIEKEALDINQFLAKQKEIRNLIGMELQLKQDEYDSDVYADSTKQAFWKNWIDEELKKYEKYADKKLIVSKMK